MNVDERAQEHGIEPLRTASQNISGQMRRWMRNNDLSESVELFPKDEAEKAVEEVFSTWKLLEPYDEDLKRFRHLRGDRAVSRVPNS